MLGTHSEPRRGQLSHICDIRVKSTKRFNGYTAIFISGITLKNMHKSFYLYTTLSVIHYTKHAMLLDSKY